MTDGGHSPDNKNTTLDMDSDSMQRSYLFTVSGWISTSILIIIFWYDNITGYTKFWCDEDRPGQMLLSHRMTITSGFDVDVKIS